MIRRLVGDEYWLISQHDHALISGMLARGIGSNAPTQPSGESALIGIGLHDCGWPLHDDQPTLNSANHPLDVFESPRQVTLPVWTRSAEIAVEMDRYAGLLVSVHVLSLSAIATRQEGPAAKSWNIDDARIRFEVNVFQHRMIEMQENLRRELGMRTDEPLKVGLAVEPSDAMEEQLIRDYQWLAAMDMLSLAVCCTDPPFTKYTPLKLKFKRLRVGDTVVTPWPFSTPEIPIQVPFRRVPAREYADQNELRELLASTPVERFTVSVQCDTI